MLNNRKKSKARFLYISVYFKFPQVCLCLSTLDLPLLSDIYYCPWSSLKPLSVSGLLLEKVQPFYIKVVTVMGTKLMTLYPVPEIWCEPLLLFIDNAIHNSCLYVCKVCVSAWHWLFRSTFCRSLWLSWKNFTVKCFAASFFKSLYLMCLTFSFFSVCKLCPQCLPSKCLTMPRRLFPWAAMMTFFPALISGTITSFQKGRARAMVSLSDSHVGSSPGFKPL